MDVLLLASFGIVLTGFFYSGFLLTKTFDTRLAIASLMLLVMAIGFVVAIRESFEGFYILLPAVASGVPSVLVSIFSVVAICYFHRLLQEQTLSRTHLAVNQENLQKTFDAIEDAIVIVNSLAVIEYANRAAEVLFGYPVAVLKGGSLQLLIPGIGESPLYRGKGVSFRPEAGAGLLEQKARGSEGEPIDVGINVATLMFNEVNCYLLTIKNVSEMRNLEASLIVRDRAFAVVPDGILITDPHQPDNPIIYCNKAFENNTGYSTEEIVGRNCRFLQGDDNRQEALIRLRLAIENEEECTVVLRNYRRDGSLFWNELCVSPVYDKVGHLTHFLGIQSDITHHIEQEEELVARNMRLLANQRSLLTLAQGRGNSLVDTFRRIVEATSIQVSVRRVSVWIWEEEQEVASCVVVYQDGAFLNTPYEIHASRHARFLETLKSSGVLAVSNVDNDELQGEFDRHYLEKTKIKSLLDVPIRLDGNLAGFLALEHLGIPRQWSQEDKEFAKSAADLCALAIAADENRQMVSALQENESKLQEAQQIARIGNFEWQWFTGDWTWSSVLYEILALSPDTFEVSSEKIFSLIHPDDVARYRKAIRDCIEQETPLQIELRMRHRDGAWRHVETRAHICRDGGQRAIGLKGTVQDITERVRTNLEKEHLEQQLAQAQKLETIGTLAGGIAHDFNNLLTPIIGYTDIVLRHMEGNEKMRPHLEQVMTGAQRAKDLILQIMSFSRHSSIQCQAVDLGKVISEALKLIRPTIPTTIEIKQDIDEGCAAVMADSSQMHQVLMNLCTNAYHAMREKGGVLTVRLKEVNVDASLSGLLPSFEQTEYICLTVQDTGSGIDPRVKERIFEPFFTTKAVDEGTGLGLSVLHGIVSRHHGEIVVDSPAEGGTAFSIYFPVLSDAAPGEEYFPTRMPAGHEKILVVDDEAPIADMAAMMLEDLGYEVKYFENPVRALAYFKEDPRSFDLLLTDLTMPGLDGVELATECHRLNSDLPILVMTGYEEEAVTRATLQSSPIDRVVRKPLIGARLAQVVREILDSVGTPVGTDVQQD